jgi:dynein heavy chain 1
LSFTINKKSLLEDQQFHLNVGLDKLKQTETQVLEMQGSLDEKKKELGKERKRSKSKNDFNCLIKNKS